MLPKPPIKIGPFPLGMNNRVPDTRLGTKDGSWLRSAVNVDLDESGFLSRRDGTTLVQAGTGCHSMWGDGEKAFYVDGGVLYQVTDQTEAFTRTVVTNGFAAGVPVSYGRVDEHTTYWTNGLLGGRIVDGVNHPWSDYVDTASGKYAPMPLGTIVRFYNGRLLVARDDVLFFSEAYLLDRYAPADNFIQFLAPITLVVATEGGVFVVADKTYWFGGALNKTEMRMVLDYGGVPGSEFVADGGYGWMSKRGMVVAKADGSAENVQEKALAIDSAAVGASVFKKTDGLKQAITSLFGAETSKASAKTFMTAEIVRKGTTL